MQFCDFIKKPNLHAPHLDFSQVLPRLGEKLPGSTHMNEKSSRSHAVTWTPFLLGLVVWWFGRWRFRGWTNKSLRRFLVEALLSRILLKFPFMTGKSERSDIILGRQLICCKVPGPSRFHASQSQGYSKEDQRWLCFKKGKIGRKL